MNSVMRKASTRSLVRAKELYSAKSFSVGLALLARTIGVERSQTILGTASPSYTFHSCSRIEAVRPALLKKERQRQQEKQAAELREVRARMDAVTKPDPILGHQLNEAGRKFWESSDLCRVVLTKDEVWGVREDRRGNLISIDDVTDVEKSTSSGQVHQTVSLGPGPKRLNFGLDNEEDRALLFGDLPAVIVEDKIRVSSTHVSLTNEDISSLSRSLEADEEAEREHSDQLSRILDLRNANGRAIRVENIRRIIEHFGARRKEDGTVYYDSGSPETQAAVLTYRIRNLHEHSLQARHDNSNRRGMTMLVHQRAKILKYLKKKSEDRYQALLPRLGLERRAVEGEIIVPGKPRMAVGV